MESRRSFFRKTMGLASAASLSSLSHVALAEDISDALLSLNQLPLDASISDEDLWKRMAQAYTVSATYLNLNNGGVSPQPKVVQDAVDRYYHLSNEMPTYYMWHVLDKGREALRGKLADLAGTSAEEIAINRNTTEALGTITWGLDMQKGDEIVMTKQDYPNMIHAWKQREVREGIKINWINLSLPVDNDEVVLKAYIDATTPKTKIWHITHLITWTGQILPAEKLCAEARKRGIITIVDAAHSFAQLDFKVGDLQCDYLGASLHKWLCAPFGTGLLYMRKERIGTTWSLFPNDNPKSSDIRKFEALGTRSFAPEQAIAHAIDFHHAIGSQRKQQRLHYLKTYWCQSLMKHPRIKLHISLNPNYSCALGTFSIDGMKPNDIVAKLFNEYQIHTTPINWENVSAVRVSPNVYTTTKDLDRFIDAVTRIAAS